jgi:hypothetical protein
MKTLDNIKIEKKKNLINHCQLADFGVAANFFQP